VTPAPTWSDATVSFATSQFTEGSGFSYSDGASTATYTITAEGVTDNSIIVSRSPTDWGYQIKYYWSINSTVDGYFTGPMEGIGIIDTAGYFDTLGYNFDGSSTSAIIFIKLLDCEINDTTYDPSAMTYTCAITYPDTIIVTYSPSLGKDTLSTQLGKLPVWIWYAIAAGVLVIPILSYMGYRYYKKKKLAELLKETKEEELKDAQELDDAANFGGLGDAVTFNPLATGGTHDIATGGEYIDQQLAAQKQQFETAQVDVDVMNFKQDFGQVQAVKN